MGLLNHGVAGFYDSGCGNATIRAMYLNLPVNRLQIL